MKIHDYPETDSLYIELRPQPGTAAREVAPGLILDHAAARFDLTTVDTVALPRPTVRAA